MGGDRHRARRQLYQPRGSRRRRRCVLDSAGARRSVCRHGAYRDRSAARLARRADYSVGPARRRRDDHGGNDGGPA